MTRKSTAKAAPSPRSRASKGTSEGRVYVPLTVDERRALDALAAQEARTSSAMARQIYQAGLKAIGAIGATPTASTAAA